jgi:hypothetical protein
LFGVTGAAGTRAAGKVRRLRDDDARSNRLGLPELVHLESNHRLLPFVVIASRIQHRRNILNPVGVTYPPR